MEAGGSGRLSRCTGDSKPEEKGEKRLQKSGVSQSKGGEWGWHKDTEGEGK